MCGALLPVQTALLTLAVGVSRTRGVGGVGPFTLDLPLAPVREGHRGNIEGPGALVAVFLAATVVPSARAGRIGAGL